MIITQLTILLVAFMPLVSLLDLGWCLVTGHQVSWVNYHSTPEVVGLGIAWVVTAFMIAGYVDICINSDTEQWGVINK
jgi:hypothetical protein